MTAPVRCSIIAYQENLLFLIVRSLRSTCSTPGTIHVRPYVLTYIDVADASCSFFVVVVVVDYRASMCVITGHIDAVLSPFDHPMICTRRTHRLSLLLHYLAYTRHIHTDLIISSSPPWEASKQTDTRTYALTHPTHPIPPMHTLDIYECIRTSIGL